MSFSHCAGQGESVTFNFLLVIVAENFTENQINKLVDAYAKMYANSHHLNF